MLRTLLVAALLALLGGCATDRAAKASAEKPPVTILVSIDGFRPDYLGLGSTPTLDALAAGGVRAAMRPSFPTKTFPNHYTLVTGLRPDEHGIVDNNMEDTRRPGARFSLGNAKQALDPFWWDAAEPIWVTAERQGVRTATMFWPGSEVPIRGVRPSTWQRYDQSISNRQRVEAVMDWLRRPPERRPRFVTLYFDTVDTAGHAKGPGAPEVMAAVAEVDARIGELVAEMKALGQPANLVIVSDHGMAATRSARVVRIDRLLDPAAIRVVSDGAFLGINPLPGREAEVERVLLAPPPNLECWRRGELPARFRYGQNARVPAIFCLAATGWLVAAGEPTWPADGGAHGYDDAAPEMAALFIAHGPAFAERTTLPPFDNVAVYTLLARLLGVRPAVEGDASVADRALRR
jgi:predicted AlkP superfamily pyrophosphatase or phosphodiesterase